MRRIVYPRLATDDVTQRHENESHRAGVTDVAVDRRQRADTESETDRDTEKRAHRGDQHGQWLVEDATSDGSEHAAYNAHGRESVGGDECPVVRRPSHLLKHAVIAPHRQKGVRRPSVQHR